MWALDYGGKMDVTELILPGGDIVCFACLFAGSFAAGSTPPPCVCGTVALHLSVTGSSDSTYVESTIPVVPEQGAAVRVESEARVQLGKDLAALSRDVLTQVVRILSRNCPSCIDKSKLF